MGHLVQVAGQGVGDAAVDGDFVGHAGVAPDGEVLNAEDGAREGVQQLVLLRDQHRQHPGIVVPAVATAADSVSRRMQQSREASMKGHSMAPEGRCTHAGARSVTACPSFYSTGLLSVQIACFLPDKGPDLKTRASAVNTLQNVSGRMRTGMLSMQWASSPPYSIQLGLVG